MWCVRCRGFWNWDTGRVIDTRRHVPHNPDHRAWLARGNGGGPARELDDLPCGGVPTDHAMHAALLAAFERNEELHPGTAVAVAAADAVRTAQQLRLHAYARAWDEARVAEPVRISFLLGDLRDEEAFATALERLDRTLRLKRDVAHVLEMYVLSTTDVLQRLATAHESLDTVTADLERVRALANLALAEVGRAYDGRAVPALGDDWRWALPRQRRLF
jgi:hypothetical protein